MIADQVYTGRAIEPTADQITVTLKVGGSDIVLNGGTDFTVVEGSYKNNTNFGTASVTIEGNREKGFTGTKTINFKITQVQFPND